MKNKGFTLVEIIVSIAILGLLALGSIPLLTFGYVNLFESDKYTTEAYKVQQSVEQAIEAARDSGTEGGYEVKIFEGESDEVTVKGYHINYEVPLADTSYGEIHVFVPKYEVVYTVPAVTAMSEVTAWRNGGSITTQNIVTLASTSSYVTLRASEPTVSNNEWLMNVYRWYMSPVMDFEDYGDLNLDRDLIIIQEWNEARPEMKFADAVEVDEEEGPTLVFIPNVEVDYNELDFRDFFSHIYLDEEEVYADLTSAEEEEICEWINEEFSGRFFFYSVTPYSTIGRIGQEVFSDEIIYVTAEP